MAIQPPLSAGDGRPDTAPPPDRRPLVSVSEYSDAVRAVDALSEARFPVEHLAIVGRGVRTLEDVTGRYGTVRAVGSAVFVGALVGLFFGTLFDWWGVVTPEVSQGWLAVTGLAYGAFGGLVVALLVSGASMRREFSSVRTLEADHYDVTLTGGDRAQALRILHEAGIA